MICKVGYYYFYKIDFNAYSEMISLGTYNSPNDKYSLRMSILVPRNKDDECYLLGQLIRTEFIVENHQITSDENTKVVYFEKRKYSDVLEKNVYVNWINETQFQIENARLEINGRTFDYRRRFFY